MSIAAQTGPPLMLFEHLEALKPQVASASKIALFLDFDGTLSKIVPNPNEAELDSQVRSVLNTLVARPDFTLSFVSGRALADVRQRVGLKNVIYVGNHGLEIESDSTCFREPEAERLRRELRRLSLQLKLALSETDGLEIEDKGLTLSVHFRRVNEALHDWVRNATFSAVERSRCFICREGKMVLEVKPDVNWHKGHAVKWIAKEILRSASLSIYIGDDATDEDAFAAIPEGITIKVGEAAETHAQYFLSDIQAVGQFLHWLDQAKPHASLANSQRVGR